jgi:hypothetical protein
METRREIRYRMLLDRVAVLRAIRDGIVCLRWVQGGARAPFPPAMKRALLQDLSEKYGVDLLVETGTYLGDTSAHMARSFRLVHTIEAARELFDVVAPRFAKIPNVRRYFGDSGSVLSTILPLLDGPALFWLDAHVQGFAQEGSLNPILREVMTIGADTRFNHILAIDDMRLFGSAQEYPTIEDLREVVIRTGRRHHLTIAADIGIVRFESA